MPTNRSSSDSSGGAPLRSGALKATPQKDGMGSTKSSDSPTDDEMALVHASDKFNRLVNDAHGYRPLVAADEYHQGLQLQRPPTTRPSTTFSGQSPFGQCVSVAPSIASSPLYRGFGDIQARLVTAQQYVRITPGFNNDQAQIIQQLLVGVGQDLTHFATTVIQEHTKSQHQTGELRVQYEKAQNELLSRRQQISELQEQYKELALEKDLETKTVTSLERQIESHQSEVRRLQKLIKNHDQKHMKHIQALEDEIKSLRMSQEDNMQLVKVASTPKNKANHEESDCEEEIDPDQTKAPAARRKSSLNPAAPEFGPRCPKSDHSKEMLPLLRKYANEGAAQAAGRGTESEDVRPYNYANNNFEPARHTPTRMGFRSGSSSHTNTFGNNSRALIPSGHQQQSRFKSTAEFINVDYSKLQTKASWDADDITLGFIRLFGMIEGLIAKHHIQAPFNENDNMLMMSHPATWNYILSMGLRNQSQSASHMLDLLTRHSCRHWVMKRIILDYIINRIMVPEVFFGFNDAIDSHLHALQGRMKSRIPGQSGPNATRPQGLERQRIVTDHAKVIQFIVEAPEHDDFKRRTVARHTKMLAGILKPMRSCSIEDGKADKDLAVVVNAAYTITTKIWVSGMTLHYYFPETGSKFAYGTMRSLNYVDVPSDQMQYQQYRIMLVVTPTLSLRDDRDMDRLRTHELLKADVLVMR